MIVQNKLSTNLLEIIRKDCFKEIHWRVLKNFEHKKIKKMNLNKHKEKVKRKKSNKI